MVVPRHKDSYTFLAGGSPLEKNEQLIFEADTLKQMKAIKKAIGKSAFVKCESVLIGAKHIWARLVFGDFHFPTENDGTQVLEYDRIKMAFSDTVSHL